MRASRISVEAKAEASDKYPYLGIQEMHMPHWATAEEFPATSTPHPIIPSDEISRFIYVYVVY